ncbi:inositol monophosphatase family protein [Enterococcus xiangfangensis]|uniref:inositol monophosphatase family protein n=1 Tax=Enterococcus xiangfangensis TaxID=1296537 RepID=UPI0010F74477|nr:inositol monophosphatase family protein [Enterococcus xiangfangensis]MBM7711690.1 myo-inositol-1(or 4)-monophosphatase [Enterococcus xiangfangensis]
MEKEIISWIYEAAEKIKTGLGSALKVDEKSDRTDLVTNVDKEVQNFLVEKINTYDPDAKILGEENGLDQTPIDEGRVFVIDPIDGTMNFVMQQENFCVMVAVYEDGIGQLGFIYDVMRDELFWGGARVGKVFYNRKEISVPKNKQLKQGLIGMNAALYRHNFHHAQDIGNKSMGIRILGCAGLEFIAMIKGTQIGYISMLSPWDYAAGKIMMDQLGMPSYGADQQSLTFRKRELFIGGTEAAVREIQAFNQENQ